MTSRSLAAHRAAVMARVEHMQALDVTLVKAAGGMVTDDVRAEAPLPATDVAQFDGYAVSAADTAGAAIPYPVVLPVSHDVSFSSRAPRRHVRGAAARIVTGAPLPQGADAVVGTSLTDAGLAQVSITRSVVPGEGVRSAGSDVADGEVVIPAGTRLGARHLAVAAALGRARLTVTPVPRVVIIPVGSELIESNAGSTNPGGVHESSAHLLAHAIEAAGARAYRLSPVADDRFALRQAIDDHVVRADVLILTGGMSGAPGDCVAEVMSEVGEFEVVDLELSPGGRHGTGSVDVGSDRTIPVFALPGSPVSTAAAFETYVRPALRAMSGLSELHRSAVMATVEQGWSSPPGKSQWVPCLVTGDEETGFRIAGLGSATHVPLLALGRANGYAIVGPEVTEVHQGSTLACVPWGR